VLNIPPITTIIVGLNFKKVIDIENPWRSSFARITNTSMDFVKKQVTVA